MQNKKITFIGAGNMASSIITGLVNNGYDAKSICACAPSKNHTQQLADSLNITISDNNAESVEWAEVIILGVKPQIMADVCQQLVDSGVGLSSKLFISIAAGISVQRLQSILGKQTNIIRTMPNTPSLVQKGMMSKETGIKEKESYILIQKASEKSLEVWDEILKKIGNQEKFLAHLKQQKELIEFKRKKALFQLEALRDIRTRREVKDTIGSLDKLVDSVSSLELLVLDEYTVQQLLGISE